MTLTGWFKLRNTATTSVLSILVTTVTELIQSFSLISETGMMLTGLPPLIPLLIP